MTTDKTALPKIMEPDKISALIERAAAASGKAHELRHRAAFQALLHFGAHGDTSLIVTFLTAMKGVPGVLVPAYVSWFRKFSPATIELVDGKIVVTKDKDPGANKLRPEAAFNNPAEMSAEARAALSKPLPDFSAEYVRERLISLMKGINKAATDENSKRHVSGDPAILSAALSAAVKAFEANLKPVAVLEKEPVAA